MNKEKSIDYTNIKIKPVKYTPKNNILCFDLDGNFVKLFKDLRECVKWIDNNNHKKYEWSRWGSVMGAIRVCLKGGTKTSQGFQWVYENDLKFRIKKEDKDE